MIETKTQAATKSEGLKVVTDVVCPFCGTLCDDVKVVLDGNRIVDTMNACIIGNEKFKSAQAGHRVMQPLEREEGTTQFTPVSYDYAVEKAAQILAKAKRPLFYGWSSTSCEAQEVGNELAEVCRGVTDNTATVCHGPSIMAIQTVGAPQCTLGEVKNRADLIIYWGCNPIHAHPRHMSRYTIYPRGFFTERGFDDRTLVVVDPRPTDTAKQADIYVQVEQGKDYEVLDALRTATRGEDIPDVVGGVPKAQIVQLAELAKTKKFGLLFFGMGVTQTIGKHRNIDIAISWVADMNKYTKFSLIPMRGHYNVTGSGQVMCWQSGFPFAMDFSRGYPRYNPGETTSNDLLRRGEVDAAMVIASDPGAHFPVSSMKHYAKIPTIALDPHYTPTTGVSNIVIPSTMVGVEEEGTAYRMDNVPIRCRKVIDGPEGMLSDEEVLRRILARVKELKGLPAGQGH
ncbi:tungsten-containing formylmethanofuran dehydrogenase subunit B [Methanocella paludicola SANAE]|uniref:formylmethanofuran dehydrogenase subunit B n=1 Tax=Methanocella paludicola (strain DSM 17711 / JCM 13418 / NBRC 101707 / SANAE) TaxID=304371 RepID=D1YYX3_METPS|nr:formylmethanofuran dehydrogenase subunit B [Methanocella paludicola]BAI61645.1 tungsten-containing formylmethanofuran dehydrogenase subunit B [Methanocella paludicola SANAE]BAI62837.1 tungsten-containing formylmethanofuran dehydrogenase subunit B [Methanocella paludicola SANAE]